MSPILFFIIFFICTGVGKIFLQINSAAVAFIDILIAAWEGLNRANTSDTEAPFLDLHLSVSNRFVSSKIHDRRDDFDFDIVNFPFLDGHVPCSTSYGV